ncbi:unnamed protein product [Commensalibacter communis]|uniref:hypothetical protein n=1 Tax=Commensalibacter communis TaxID=2972786 RepID=UPI0022FFAFAD|nr:hypothetical protein [Commensalibacter communis]CAI3927727.1 unnamed protein product [Commensalibacter communis]CAI3931427.1 unnamed protein product [Commensalibacter communis]
MTENPYIFVQKKTFTTALNHYLIQTELPCFVVNHLAHIYFIAEFIKKTSINPRNTSENSPSFSIISPPNAVTYLGVRWWLAFINTASTILPRKNFVNILDCYDHAGLAMAAIREGQKYILFESESPHSSLLKNRAEQTNTIFITNKPSSFNLLTLSFKKK